jgi:hypothetical protein
VEHWKPGASAYELARSWETAQGFPAAVRAVLDGGSLPEMHGLGR